MGAKLVSAFVFSGISLFALSQGGRPVAGSIEGSRFRPTGVNLSLLGDSTASAEGKVVDRVKTYRLEFRTGQGFMADESINIWFSIDTDKSVSGLKLVSLPFEFGSEGYSKQRFPKKTLTSQVGRGITSVFLHRDEKLGPRLKVMSVNDGIECALTFETKKGNSIAGSVQLSLKKHPKTSLSGRFVATIEG